jgi:hypothetical protein
MKKIKRFIAGLFVSCYMLSLGIVASAEEVNPTTDTTIVASTVTTNVANSNITYQTTTDDDNDPVGW